MLYLHNKNMYEYRMLLNSVTFYTKIPTSEEWLLFLFFSPFKGNTEAPIMAKLHCCSSEDVLAEEIPFQEKFNNFLPEYSPLLEQL